jgi:tRNA pseudouridine13 synthase
LIEPEPLPYAHGGPPLRGRLRAEAADFEVEEQIGFVPTGSGEHAFLSIEKTGTNTEWLAGRIARFAKVAPMAVGYSGLKDRHAVTRQYFSVHLPGRPDPDWSALALEGVRVLEATRHDRKLKRGSHRGNRFTIRLRDVGGDRAQAEQRIATIRELGVPNHFGEQRFGRDGANVDLARALFAGRRLGRAQRGIALSAARSRLFNAVLAERVANGSWNRALDGDVWMLDGSHAIFGPLPVDEDIATRLAGNAIHPTGPLWGAGELRSESVVRALEQAAADRWSDLAAGLAAADLKQERRALRLRVAGFAHRWIGEDSLQLDFSLPAGAYATTLLRELCEAGTHPTPEQVP